MYSIYFTLCSNNYLPFAKVLGASLKELKPETRFIIGLVDKLDPKVDYSDCNDFEILPCFELGYAEFEGMLSRYNIIEFNTAVKPFYFEYLFNRNPEVEKIYYIDPDIVFYQSPDLLEKEWGNAEILLTPNLIYLPKKTSTGELTSLRHGMNNLGFLGLKKGEEAFKLISWWKERLTYHCRIEKCQGVFVDQKWIDLASLFFDKIKSVKHPGWNMGWWNFSERQLIESSTGLFVNHPDSPLVFFHFSGYKPEREILTERIISDEFVIDENSPLRNLYEDYKNRLLDSGYESLSKVKPGLKFYQAPNSTWNNAGRKLKSKFNNLIYRVFKV